MSSLESHFVSSFYFMFPHLLMLIYMFTCFFVFWRVCWNKWEAGGGGGGVGGGGGG